MLDARCLCASLSILALWVGACSSESGSGDSAVAEGPDAGSDDDGTGGDSDCVPEVVEMPVAAACLAATQTCLDACEDDACYDTCLAADPDPEGCALCIDDAYIACGNQMGCQAEWDALICCYDGCADPESAECDTGCAPEGGAYENCLGAHDDACSEATTVCFQP
jgi:hypothetical protein